jgi:hypothetical protein
VEKRVLGYVMLSGPTGYTSTTDNISAADNGKKTSHAASPYRLGTAGLQELSHLSRPAAVSTVQAAPAHHCHGTSDCLCTAVFTVRPELISKPQRLLHASTV